MKTPLNFPQLPLGLSTKLLREEIRRRLEEAEKMGLVRRPKKVTHRAS
jgi:hypothetical protein